MIKEIHQKLVNKEITAVELINSYFQVIDEKDNQIKAFLTLTKEQALQQAKKIDEKIKKGQDINVLEGKIICWLME
jgi:aspartyl-tRNA(Asn)/glutamyl-tRNA(Gln) amidotransferase subunit A